MTRRQIVLLVMGVVMLHLGIFWLLGGAIRTLPPPRFKAPPQDDLRVQEASFDHPETGEKLVYREIRVSTRLAYPDALIERGEGSATSQSPVVSDPITPSFSTP